MASSNLGDRSSAHLSSHLSSPALSAHPGPESPGARAPGAEYQDSKFNLLPAVSTYPEETSDDGRKISQSPFSDEKVRGSKTADGKKMEVVDKQKVSGSRKRWLFFVWLLTFWMPSFLIRWIVRTTRKDVREAWREKLAINMLIWLSCCGVVFFMSTFP
jgi:chitin synthase